MGTIFDYLVVGAGMFGSSAARYLSERPGVTALLGPAEPDEPGRHRGVFGAHHDQARITRVLSSDAHTAEFARRSLAQFPEIQARVGRGFHRQTGVLFLADRTHRDYLDRLAGMAADRRLHAEHLDPGQLAARFPYLEAPRAIGAILEGPPAGHFNPRQFVRAQIERATNLGCQVIPETAWQILPGEDSVKVRSDSGETYRARKVLIAAGAFSNAHDLYRRKFALNLKGEYVVLVRIPESELGRYADMPALIYENAHERVTDLYVLPPVRYRDGQYYLKMGANTYLDRLFRGLDALSDWYRQGDSDRMLDEMRAVLLELLPSLPAEDWHTRRCVITRTVHGQPYIDELERRCLYVAVGGNGHSAKTADAVGKLAAGLVASGRWTEDLPRKDFEVRYQDENPHWSSPGGDIRE